MGNTLDKDQIEDFVDNVLNTSRKNFWRGDDLQICCPVHGESNPSMGMSVTKQTCHCFSCGFSGSFAWLLYNSNKDEYKTLKQAQEFLESRYEVSLKNSNVQSDSIKRYGEGSVKLKHRESKTLPLFKIAPFMSGKETYKYFFTRGFTKEDMKKYMIGRDLDNKTVTIPVFNEKGELLGVIGRYISKNRKKNERYMVYSEFNRSETLYPLNHFELIDNTIILVEGQFDAIQMHKYGYKNTLSLLSNSISKTQAEWIGEHCSCVIYVGDSDNRGVDGRNAIYEKLKHMVKFKVVDFPPHGKDPCDWSKEEVDEMIKNAHGIHERKIRRY